MHHAVKVAGFLFIAISIISGLFGGNMARLGHSGAGSIIFIAVIAGVCGVLFWALATIVEQLIAIRRSASSQLKIFNDKLG